MTVSVAGLAIERQGDTLRITFDRPERLNSVTAEILHAAAEAVENADESGARVIVLSGSGRAFSSGADVSPDGSPPGLDTLDAANRLVLAIAKSPVVVVAAVNGIAAGVGCSVALAADLAIAKESAGFMLAFTRIGLMPDGGASMLVPAAIGRARAARMALLAEKVSATTAAEWGLIAEVVADDAFAARVEDLVGQLAAGPPLAYAATKRVLNAGTLSLLEAILHGEREGQAPLLESADFAEGMAAFQQKRPATFTGS
jgi:enoyl-CoA hydratase/carnithine racemase